MPRSIPNPKDEATRLRAVWDDAALGEALTLATRTLDPALHACYREVVTILAAQDRERYAAPAGPDDDDRLSNLQAEIERHPADSECLTLSRDDVAWMLERIERLDAQVTSLRAQRAAPDEDPVSRFRYAYRQAPSGFGFAPLAEVFETEPVEVGTMTAPDPEAVCERVFERHNLDERPRAREIRSMSVGDLVSVTVLRHFVCAPTGWLEVTPAIDRRGSVAGYSMDAAGRAVSSIRAD